MNNVQQEAIWYSKNEHIIDICKEVQLAIENGWFVKSSICKNDEVIIIYEKTKK